MRAVILAGGKGTRLRPYTVVLPKPLMPIGEYPILEVVIRQLVQFGFNHITLAVNHQAELMNAFFGDGRKWGVKIDYSLEDQPLGTMGPLKLIKDLGENFLVMNGDILTDLDYGQLYEGHVKSKVMFTISSHEREHRVDYGVLEVGQQGYLGGFKEKPFVKYEVSMGVYMANRAIVDMIPPSVPFGFDQLMLNLLKKNIPVAVRHFEGYWLDIGRPDDYMKAIDEFENLKERFLK